MKRILLACLAAVIVVGVAWLFFLSPKTTAPAETNAPAKSSISPADPEPSAKPFTPPVAKAETAPPPAPAASPANKDAGKPAAADEVGVIKFRDFGELVVEFWPDVAPGTVENFKKLARDKFYDGTASHRLIAGFMLQMGDPLTKDPANEDRWGTGDPGYKIKAEFNERKHVRGVLSMARSRNPDSAGSQFFVCFGPAPSLDNQYTGFGRVIQGEEVLAKLEAVPVADNKHTGEHSAPIARVHVESIRIVDRATLK